MKKSNNVFISHYWKDDAKVQRLKERLINKGYNIRNYSVDSTKHTEKRRPSDEVIKRFLRRQVSWSGTFICLVGKKTHTRPWVNYEIEQAKKQGKKIIGIYTHGNNESVPLPKNLKKYSSLNIGWNSLDKLGEVMNNESVPFENPSAYPMYSAPSMSCA